jgi:hypothetical protein
MKLHINLLVSSLIKGTAVLLISAFSYHKDNVTFNFTLGTDLAI